jgi:hypothetical protein
MRIGQTQRPPILVQRDRRWRINPAAGFDFANPFFTDHMNEAMNPCHYGWLIRGGIARGVRKRSHDWLTFYHMTSEQFELHSKTLTTWFGEDYGYRGDDVILVSAP